MATPSLLQIYLHRCEPADFGSLHFLMVGAEKLPDRLATAFEERFGIRPVEGYGCTECSPVVTGDVATLDEDGFLHITDRLSRFSKIGGEMVPHIKVEEKLHEAAGVTESTFAVAGVPDPKKGERLVVLHTLPDDRLQALLRKLPSLGLPNLWLPRPNHFFHVDALPLLPTDKMDLRKIRELALAWCAREDAEQEGGKSSASPV